MTVNVGMGIQLPPGENVKVYWQSVMSISLIIQWKTCLNFNMDLTRIFVCRQQRVSLMMNIIFWTENVSGNTFSIYDLRTKGLSNAGKWIKTAYTKRLSITFI